MLARVGKLLYRAVPQYTTMLKRKDTNRKDERIHELRYEIISGEYLQIQAMNMCSLLLPLVVNNVNVFLLPVWRKIKITKNQPVDDSLIK